ncbi:Outer arm dynein light chain 1 protein [Thalictrum thalictroides]|uniref:Outer arm dynein light chain 1 protein n=1 Tax=Thalictrum thalictroides TaxID=46969 RepID=A0A7J6V0U7_THATH|nr:Outer arm dynein light chain 1 protein [Thalictrum thalictroides]
MIDLKENSVQNVNELPNKDFKIKRIQEWVNMIDLKETLSEQDICESFHSIDKAKRGSYVLGNASNTKLDSKSTHGMEAAKKYVSSLPASSTSAQLANLGLVVVPFLSTFNSLKTLNLSGNANAKLNLFGKFYYSS